jgi:hypothetical protein
MAGPPLAREATAGSLARRAGQSNWSAPTQGPVGLKLAELVSAGSLCRVWGVLSESLFVSITTRQMPIVSSYTVARRRQPNHLGCVRPMGRFGAF